MPVRVNLGLQLEISSNNNTTNYDIANFRFAVNTSAWNEAASKSFTLADGATDEQVDLCELSDGRFILLVAEPVDENAAGQSLIMKLSSALGEAINLAPYGNRREIFFLITSSDLTALWLTNASGQAMKVRLVSAGD